MKSRTKASFSYLPRSVFEWSLARKLHFHIFHLQFQQFIQEISEPCHVLRLLAAHLGRAICAKKNSFLASNGPAFGRWGLCMVMWFFGYRFVIVPVIIWDTWLDQKVCKTMILVNLVLSFLQHGGLSLARVEAKDWWPYSTWNLLSMQRSANSSINRPSPHSNSHGLSLKQMVNAIECLLTKDDWWPRSNIRMLSFFWRVYYHTVLSFFHAPAQFPKIKMPRILLSITVTSSCQKWNFGARVATVTIPAHWKKAWEQTFQHDPYGKQGFLFSQEFSAKAHERMPQKMQKKHQHRKNFAKWMAKEKSE